MVEFLSFLYKSQTQSSVHGRIQVEIKLPSMYLGTKKSDGAMKIPLTYAFFELEPELNGARSIKSCASLRHSTHLKNVPKNYIIKNNGQKQP